MYFLAESIKFTHRTAFRKLQTVNIFTHSFCVMVHTKFKQLFIFHISHTHQERLHFVTYLAEIFIENKHSLNIGPKTSKKIFFHFFPQFPLFIKISNFQNHDIIVKLMHEIMNFSFHSKIFKRLDHYEHQSGLQRYFFSNQFQILV